MWGISPHTPPPDRTVVTGGERSMALGKPVTKELPIKNPVSSPNLAQGLGSLPARARERVTGPEGTKGTATGTGAGGTGASGAAEGMAGTGDLGAGGILAGPTRRLRGPRSFFQYL